MTNYRIIFTENDVSLPDGACVGIMGEHNAVQLAITLPDAMVSDMSYHTIRLGSVVSARIMDSDKNVDGAIRVGNTIYQPLTAAYTTESCVDLSVTAYKQTGSAVQVVDITPTVYGLRFGAGQPMIKPGGLPAEVTALENDVHDLGREVDALRDDLPSADEIEAWNGAADKAHEHKNGKALDAITSEKIDGWDESADNSHDHRNKPSIDKLLIAESYADLPANAADGTVAVVTGVDSGLQSLAEYDADADTGGSLVFAVSPTHDATVVPDDDILLVETSTDNQIVSAFLPIYTQGTSNPPMGAIFSLETATANSTNYALIVSSAADIGELLADLGVIYGQDAEVTAIFVFAFDSASGLLVTEDGAFGADPINLSSGWNVIYVIEDNDNMVYGAVPINDPNAYCDLGTFDEFEQDAHHSCLYDMVLYSASADKRGIYHRDNGEWKEFYPQNKGDDVTPLGFGTYSDLVLRDDAITGESTQDVPVYVGGSLGTICKLYKYDANADTSEAEPYDMIDLSEFRQADTGMPVRVIRVKMGLK